MLDGEVVLIQIIQVKRSAERVWTGKQAGAADSDGEVRPHVEALGKALEQDRNGVAPAVVGDEVVICEGVKARAGRADLRSLVRMGWERVVRGRGKYHRRSQEA